MKRELQYAIERPHEGSSVYTYLRRQLCMSSRLVRALKRTERGILVNGRPATVLQPLHSGDELRLLLVDEQSSPGIPPFDIPLQPVYEDEDILIINKPPLISTLPPPGERSRSIGGAVLHYYGRRGEQFVFRPVNRLDRGTAGLMAVAKHAYAHERLQAQLHSEDFLREYTALAVGEMAAPGVIDAPIGRCADSIIKRCVCAHGAAAVTEYRPIAHRDGNTLLRLRLQTGRTHQIRVHLAHIGHPVVNDFLYGTEDPRYTHLQLYSSRISLLHPISGERLEWQLPQLECGED